MTLIDSMLKRSGIAERVTFIHRFNTDRRLDLLCADHDREIDRLVYQLYELTDDEIAIVEGTDSPLT